MKKFHLSLYVSAGIISFIIFVTGVFAGILVNEIRAQNIQRQSVDISKILEDVETQLVLLQFFPSQNGSCDFYSMQINLIAEELGKMEKALYEYERTRRVDFPEFIEMKKDYNLLLIRYWVFAENMRIHCNSTSVTVLYFYNKTCTSCNDQGLILTYYKDKLREKLLVFALDTDLNLTSTKMLVSNYNIRVVPTLVVNGLKFEGFYNKEKLGELLCNVTNSTLSICA